MLCKWDLSHFVDKMGLEEDPDGTTIVEGRGVSSLPPKLLIKAHPHVASFPGPAQLFPAWTGNDHVDCRFFEGLVLRRCMHASDEKLGGAWERPRGLFRVKVWEKAASDGWR